MLKKNILYLLLITLSGLTGCSSSDAPTPTPPTEPATTRDPVTAFIRGADISWYTEMNADGKKFYNSAGEERTCPTLMKETGMNMVRLRVWVNPQNRNCAYSDTQDVARKAAEAYKAGLNVMIDFHLSDWWADPSRQDMPSDWTGLSHEELQIKVGEHVRQVLTAIKAQGSDVAWVQVGNETRNGMMYPDGQWWNDQGDLTGGRRRFAELYMAGYRAAKEIFPQAKVMPHLNHAYEDNTWWIEQFKSAGGQFDMIALSHYPQTDDASRAWPAMNQLAEAQIKKLAAQYGVPVLVAEFGVEQNDVATGSQIASDFMKRMKALGSTVCAGVIYWEPETYGGWKPQSYNGYGWGAYGMGAFTTQGRPSSILDSWHP